MSSMQMTTEEKIQHYQRSIDRSLNDHSRLLHCIKALARLPVTVQLLTITGVGRTVNSLRKIENGVGDAAKHLVGKWKEMVSNTPTSPETDDHGQEEQENHEYDSSNCNQDYESNPEDTAKRKSFDNGVDESEDIDAAIANLQSSASPTMMIDIDTRQGDSSNEENDGPDEPEEHEEVKESRSKSSDHSSKHSSSSSKKDSHSKSSNKDKHSSSKDRHELSKTSKSSKDKESSSEHKSKEKSTSSSKDKDRDRKHSENKKRKAESSSSDGESKKKRRKSIYDEESDDDTEENNFAIDDNGNKDNSSSDDDQSETEIQSTDKESSRKSDKYKSKDKHRSSSSHSSKTKNHESSGKSKKENKHSSSKSEDRKKEEKHNTDKESSSKSKSSSSTSSKESKSSSKSRKEEKDKKDQKDDKGKSKEKKENKDQKGKKDKKKGKTDSEEEGGIDGNSGTSFADALGMCMMPPPSKKKKDTSSSSSSKSNKVDESSPSPSKSTPTKVKTEPTYRAASPESPESLPLLSPNIKLEPLSRINEEVDLAATLPEPSLNYKPLPQMNSVQRKLEEDEMLSKVIHAKGQRTKVFSGNKLGWTSVPTLYEMCIRVLIDNIDALEYTGGVPYYIIKPVLERSTPDQLFILEHHNPYLMEDSDELWQFHCTKDFRTKHREEMESWREMYMRCLDEREAKLKALTANIKQSIDKSLPVRQTKLAYVDHVVKPPRNVLRQQAKYGTAHVTSKASDLKKKLITGTHVSSASNNSSSSSGSYSGIASSSQERISVPPPPVARSRTSTSSSFKKTKAPLMAKALQAIKGRYKR